MINARIFTMHFVGRYSMAILETLKDPSTKDKISLRFKCENKYFARFSRKHCVRIHRLPDLNNFMNLPRKAFPLFSKSYLQKQGFFFNLGVTVFLHQQDAEYLLSTDPERFLLACEDIAECIEQTIGRKKYTLAFSDLFAYILTEKYESLKDSNGNLTACMTLSSLLSKSRKIKLGRQTIEIPENIFEKIVVPPSR